jgi:hypothetical protein
LRASEPFEQYPQTPVDAIHVKRRNFHFDPRFVVPFDAVQGQPGRVAPGSGTFGLL